MVTNKTVTGKFVYIDSKQMPEGHDTNFEVSNIMSFVLYTQILKQSVLKPASPGITLKAKNQGVFVKHYSMPPVATKSKKLFLASRSKSRSQGH